MIPSRYQLRRHVKAVHANDKPLPVPRVYKNPTPCKFCGMVFSGKHRRRLHYREVHPEEFARSKEMHKAQKTAEESQQTQDDEQQVATTVEQDTTQQKISNKKITAEDVIRESRQGAKEKDLPQYQCKFCKKMIPSKYQLRRHVKEVHANDEPEYENPIICKFCCRVFPNINQRRNHVRVDHPEEHSKIVKGFTKTPIEDRTCSYCGRICAKRSALDIHVKVMHTHESLGVCEYCGRGFATLTHLRRHITVHTGERPFKCDYKDCGQSFREKTSFIVHQRRHTGEKPYQCEICGKSFKDQSTRKIHYRQHTGENPYSCELCGKTTKQKQNLKSHMKHFHKINNWDAFSVK
uniref:C2H2-type domain-containing protein n=2 Tax=Lutzomyia longipalpis TaxID=7200 RepID=A0A1B0CXE2_LUTLO